MLAVDPETKRQFRQIKFPAYLKSDDAKIRFIIEKVQFL